MSDAFWVALFVGIPASITAVGVILIAYWQLATKKKVEEVHQATNGLQSELVRKAEDVAYMRGVAAERKRAEEQRGRIP